MLCTCCLLTIGAILKQCLIDRFRCRRPIYGKPEPSHEKTATELCDHFFHSWDGATCRFTAQLTGFPASVSNPQKNPQFSDGKCHLPYFVVLFRSLSPSDSFFCRRGHPWRLARRKIISWVQSLGNYKCSEMCR